MIQTPSMQAALTDAAKVGVYLLVNSGAPSGNTAKGIAGPGCLLIDIVNKNIYINQGTLAAPTWNQITVP